MGFMDFNPSNMLKFKVNAKGEESMYFDVRLTDKKISGMWMVTNPDPEVDPIISLFVEDPEKKIIYNKLKRSVGSFSIQTKMKGEHKFIFSNIRNKEHKDLLFALHIEEEDIFEKQ